MRRPSEPSPRPPRVLIIGPSNVGDAILAGEVVSAVCARWPQARVTLAVGERATALFTDDPRIRTLVNLDTFSSPLGRLKLAWAFWRHAPQVVVDVRHTAYPLLLRPWAAWRYLRRPPRTLRHMRQRHLWALTAQLPRLAREAAREPAERVWSSARDRAHVDMLCERWSLNGTRPMVLLCPGARSQIKRWTAEGFARVADRLIAEAHAEVVLCGETQERPIIDEVQRLMAHPAHNAAGLTTIRQLGLLMRRARLVITNDSASLHLASAVGVPTVAIFGPTDERKYGPTAARSRVNRRRLFCAPCEQAQCRFSHECMRFVPPDEVFSAARELLSEGAGGTGQGAGNER
jgi:heptosyltransferase-2